ncbi:hypothetical protein FSP39_000407 [Pinctada imbricata]|uniref:Transmembrane protein 254 n=1 Tax=Pinctada imbricata TaxID=66713 RepID=A0AA89BXR4_PINIB|nr:hypothetical protein FSP39_000407 [Pinctada imbricata]
MDENYFRFAHPGWMLTIGFGLYVLTLSTFTPQDIPVYFGPIGSLGKYLGTNYPQGIRLLFWATVAAHVGEALYSLKLCRDRNLSGTATFKWVFQTFLFGFSSLMRLTEYKLKNK